MADPIRIISYTPHLREAFVALNRVWIERYFGMEEEDERELNDVEGVIIAPGGDVLFALPEGAPLVPESVLGCIGIYVRDPGIYEIIKLAVRDDVQGKGLGKRLMQAAMDRIGEMGAQKAIILSNSSLAPAMQLYKVMGFREAELGYKHLFERADIEFEYLYPAKEA